MQRASVATQALRAALLHPRPPKPVRASLERSSSRRRSGSDKHQPLSLEPLRRLLATPGTHGPPHSARAGRRMRLWLGSGTKSHHCFRSSRSSSPPDCGARPLGCRWFGSQPRRGGRCFVPKVRQAAFGGSSSRRGNTTYTKTCRRRRRCCSSPTTCRLTIASIRGHCALNKLGAVSHSFTWGTDVPASVLTGAQMMERTRTGGACVKRGARQR